MNKALSLLVIGFFCFFVSNAQEFSFGVKGGPSFVRGGQITGITSGGINFGGTVDADPQINFHGGGFFEVRFDKFLIRPEVVYSSMEVEFGFPNQPSIYAVDKISVPLLVGYNIWGPIDIYGGPTYQKLLDASLEGAQPTNPVITQNYPLAAQLGVKASFGRFELDLRYDRTLSSIESYRLDIDNTNYGINLADFDDDRLHQVLLSIGFKIFDSTANPGRRKGGCYF